jgi:hypothetical protein
LSNVVTGSIAVSARNSRPFLLILIDHGPIRSTQTSSHGCAVKFFGGSSPHPIPGTNMTEMNVIPMNDWINQSGRNVDFPGSVALRHEANQANTIKYNVLIVISIVVLKMLCNDIVVKRIDRTVGI